jgi:hypothetical protein
MVGLKSSLARLGLAVCAVALALPQAGSAQAGAVARNYPVGVFDSIGVAGSNLVIVHVGGAPAVSATGPAEILDKMEVVVERGELQIRPRRQFRDHFEWNDLKRATFTVTAPRLNAASLAGSGEMRVDRAEGSKFAASVAGSGNLHIATMRVQQADFSMAGSGNIIAHGSAGRADLSVAGSGNVRTRGVAVRNASVSIAGSGTAEVTAEDTANVSIIGSGTADIAGRARCSVSRIGSGHAHCNG